MQMKKKGANVITLEDVLPNGVKTEDVPGLLQFTIENVAWILVMPSKQLERSGKGGYVQHLILSSMMIDDDNKVVPVYTEPSAIDLAPLDMAGRRGICLSSDSDGLGPYASGVGDFLQYQLPRMIPRQDYQSRNS